MDDTAAAKAAGQFSDRQGTGLQSAALDSADALRRRRAIERGQQLVENQIRPIAIGRNNWLFAGSLRAGQRAAAVMSLIQSARMNGHDSYAYLKDVLTRLPTHRASRVLELLPHRWQAAPP